MMVRTSKQVIRTILECNSLKKVFIKIFTHVKNFKYKFLQTYYEITTYAGGGKQLHEWWWYCEQLEAHQMIPKYQHHLDNG